MSTQDDSLQNRIKEKRKIIDDYEVTTQAILAFISLLTFDMTNKKILPRAKFCVGRSMTTSNKNRVSPNKEVTPDIVIQRFTDDGYVIEVKKGLPADRSLWKAKFLQLIKYDDEDLKGWWTDDEKFDIYNLIGLIHQSRAVDFYNGFISYLRTKKIKIINPLAIVQYTRDIGIGTFINLQKIRGEILNKELDSILTSSKQIPIEKVVANSCYKDIKFYDSEPQAIEYIMQFLWMHIFPEIKVKRGEYNEENYEYLFNVSITDITDDLQKAYGNNNSERRGASFPKREWVHKALKKFVAIDLAADKNDDEFIIRYKKFPKDTDVLVEFIERDIKLERGKEEAVISHQLKLFKDN